MAQDSALPSRATERLLNSAMALGIEIDRDEAEGWVETTSDSLLDPNFEHVAPGTGSIPRSRRLADEMGADSIAAYVERLTDEVHEYTVRQQNYGKAARRMYNIFRLTGRDEEAAYIRDLFDEPVTALYHVAGLLRGLDAAAISGDAFDTDSMVAQVDQLILSAIRALDGPAEAEMVRRLMRLRDALSHHAGAGRADEISAARTDAISALNAYFKRLLTAVPSIASYLDSVAAAHRAAST